ncbi:hypothetical protein [Pseudomonas bohemica]|uniref:hypothetical protein n=1 Tax=Pseudomonas bohemica TaxID=2044872 RepID=UPI000DA5FAF3|nr:hypothetical protein [Pseudomonas bohemica]
MPYIVINSSNSFDPNNQVEYATADEADAKAREILQAYPQSSIRTAQLLNSYSAKVTVTSKAVPETPVETDAATA